MGAFGGEDGGGQFLEQRQFAGQRLAGGVQDAAFERRQLVRGEAHRVGERLLVPEHARMRLALQHRRRSGADLHEIAEHLVVLDFQRLDAGPRRVIGLQLGEHHLGARRQLPQFVELGVVARSR